MALLVVTLAPCTNPLCHALVGWASHHAQRPSTGVPPRPCLCPIELLGLWAYLGQMPPLGSKAPFWVPGDTDDLSPRTSCFGHATDHLASGYSWVPLQSEVFCWPLPLRLFPSFRTIRFFYLYVMVCLSHHCYLAYGGFSH